MSRALAWQRPEYRERAERYVRERYLDDRSWWNTPGEAVMVDRPWTPRDYQDCLNDMLRQVHDHALRDARHQRVNAERKAKLAAVDRDRFAQECAIRWVNARNPIQKRLAERDLLNVLADSQHEHVAALLRTMAERYMRQAITAPQMDARL